MNIVRYEQYHAINSSADEQYPCDEQCRDERYVMSSTHDEEDR